MPDAIPPSDYSIAVKDLCRMLSVTRYTVYNWIKAGTFPKPVTFSHKVVRWNAADIEHWLYCRANGITWSPVE